MSVWNIGKRSTVTVALGQRWHLCLLSLVTIDLLSQSKYLSVWCICNLRRLVWCTQDLYINFYTAVIHDNIILY